MILSHLNFRSSGGVVWNINAFVNSRIGDTTRFEFLLLCSSACCQSSVIQIIEPWTQSKQHRSTLQIVPDVPPSGRAQPARSDVCSPQCGQMRLSASFPLAGMWGGDTPCAKRGGWPCIGRTKVPCRQKAGKTLGRCRHNLVRGAGGGMQELALSWRHPLNLWLQSAATAWQSAGEEPASTPAASLGSSLVAGNLHRPQPTLGLGSGAVRGKLARRE